MPGFEAALAAALEVAGRAPSSHNSQPWAVAVVESGRAARWASDLGGAASAPGLRHLVLALDRARELTALPDHQVEMYLSCGAFLHLLLSSLRLAGWAAAELVWNRPGGPDELAPSFLPGRWQALAVVGLRPGDEGPTEDAAALERAAARRITNRAPYRPDPIGRSVLDRLRRPPLGGLPGSDAVELTVIEDPARIGEVASFVAERAGIDFAHPAAWRETHAYIRWSRAAAAEDGLPIEQLLGPLGPARKLAYRAALSPRSLALFSRVGYAEYLARRLGEVVRATPALACFSLPGERPSLAEQVAGGAAVMDFWLRATRAGAVMHPISVLLQHPALRAELQARFALPGRAFFFARLGYRSAQFPPAPRRRDPWSRVVHL